MSEYERKREVERIREQGRAAAREGRARVVPRYYANNSNGYRWLTGYDQVRAHYALHAESVRNETRNKCERFINWLMAQHPDWDE